MIAAILDDLGRPQRRRQLGPLDGGQHDVVLVTVEPELLEPGLVVSPPCGVTAALVGLAAVACQPQRDADGLLVLGSLHADRRELLLDAGQLGGELLLLLTGDVARHRPRHGLVGPLVALSLDGLLAFGQPGCLRGGFGGVAMQVVQQRCFQLGHPRRGHALSLPVPDDLGLDLLGCEVGQVAAVLVLMPSQAEPVGVALTAAAGRDSEDQLEAAAVAEERAG